MRKINYLIPVAIFCMLLLSSCFTDWTSGEGTLIISFGSSARSAYPFVDVVNDEHLDFNHTVILKNERGARIEREFTGISAVINVPAGRYTVSVKASDENEVRAFGIYEKIADVKTGKNESVNITMYSAIEVTNEEKLIDAIENSSEFPQRQLYILIGKSFDIEKSFIIGTNLIIIAENEVGINYIPLLEDSLFSVREGGTLHLGWEYMPGTITINGSSEKNGSLVTVADTDTYLYMYEGISIEGNEIEWSGGGVYVGFGGEFTMYGGNITGNYVESHGGGVYLDNSGIFTMHGGNITGNFSDALGGGVFVGDNGIFTMYGGNITGNQAAEGGGVTVGNIGTFDMRGGTISGNTATRYGGGVYIYGGTFYKTGGSIYGYGSNKVEGEHSSDTFKGHAIYASHSVNISNFQYRNTLAGTSVDLSCYINPANSSEMTFTGTWNGDEDGFIPIYTREDLEKIGVAGTGYGRYSNFRLKRDIDLEGYDWTPINLSNGIFDGNHLTISNLVIDNFGSPYQGLFGNVNNSIIKNLGLTDADISGGNFVGGIAGSLFGGTIENCYVTGSITGIENVGGIAGYNNWGMIENCNFAGNVYGSFGNIGGIAGQSDNSIIDNCSVSGTVEGADHVGGIVGFIFGNDDSEVKNSNFTGRVEGANSIGGIVGRNNDNNISNCNVIDSEIIGNNIDSSSIGGIAGQHNDGIIEECNFTGSVEGGIRAGGVVGENNNGTVENCHVTAEIVSGNDSIGGIVGWNNEGIIENCSFTGSVEGEYNIGGIAGQNNVGTIDNCSVSGNIEGEGNIGGIVGNNLSGNIDSCYVTSSSSVIGANEVDQANIGGIAGHNSNGTIRNCYTACTVTGYINVGGIVGFNGNSGPYYFPYYQEPSAVENCYATGSISGTYNAGGIAGFNKGIVINCYSTNIVEGDRAGGIVGFNNGTVGYSYSTGNIIGDNVGGIVGQNGNAQVDGNVQYCVALNRELSINIGTLGRIVGAFDGVLINNYARSDMSPIATDGVLDNKDGLDIDQNNWNSADWWIDIIFLGYEGPFEEIWDFRDNHLPVLLFMPEGTQNPTLKPSAQ